MKQKITSLALFPAMAGCSGAVVPGAKVTIANVDQGVKTTISVQGIDFNRFEDDLHA